MRAVAASWRYGYDAIFWLLPGSDGFEIFVKVTFSLRRDKGFLAPRTPRDPPVLAPRCPRELALRPRVLSVVVAGPKLFDLDQAG